jgi:hypothetical protein
MNASYFLVLLALLMPLAMCYPQPAMDEDKEQEYGEMAQSGLILLSFLLRI